MTTATKTSFVPDDLDCSSFENLKPLYEGLKTRELRSAGEVEQWLLDFSTLCDTVSEYRAKLYINKACHTDDTEIEKKYLHFVENVSPHIDPYFFELQKKYIAAKKQSNIKIDNAAIAVMDRMWQADVEVFRTENIALQTQEAKLVSEYDKLNGAMTVPFQGQEMTLQQLAKFTEQTDRALRQQTWELGEQRRLSDRQKLDDLFDQLLANRHEQAKNAGFSDYRAYVWKSRYRFDYSPQDCLAFADAVEATTKPVIEELDRQRQKALGLPALKPWDLSVDVLGRSPLSPFAQNEIPQFIEKTRRVIERISPQLGGEFASLNSPRSLDLESRKGKRPGGFQYSLEKSRYPFIFMNATGRQSDVETLLHEAGHAFHYIASRDIPLTFVRSAPIEFCEVASMSMELLTGDTLSEFYPTPQEHARAKRMLLEGVIRVIPWIAVIDSFQHWLYTNPGHSQTQRAEAWLSITRKLLSSVVDYSQHADSRRFQWQRQVHVFNYPFYYIEYAIAQLGALQVWNNFHQNPAAALAKYQHGLSLGGTKPLPELFTAAGAKLDFSRATLEPLMISLQKELAKLPI